MRKYDHNHGISQSPKRVQRTQQTGGATTKKAMTIGKKIFLRETGEKLFRFRPFQV